MSRKKQPCILFALLVCILLGVLNPLPASAHSLTGMAVAAQPGSGETGGSRTGAEEAPGKAELVSVTADAYNKVTVNWKETRGASQYYIYYKEKDASRWLQVGACEAGNCTFTHVSSKEFPIVPGKKYAYTVLPYNSISKKRGEADSRGLSVMTRPDPASPESAVWNDDRTEVTLSWSRSGGATAYLVYRKAESDTKWTRLAALDSGASQYVDKSPVTDGRSFYTVVSYNLETKASGSYDKNGVEPVSREEAEVLDLAKTLKGTRTASKTGQIILVVDHNLSFWEKDEDGSWNRKISVYCGYGSNGLSDDRTEGDRTTPIGAFPILHGFGTAENPGSSLQYKKITGNSYWSGERSTYNQWVESPRRISGEHLIDYYQYKYAMAIGFNRDPVVYKKGSAIFLHCKSYDHWSTAGCVSVEEPVMKQLLQMSHNGVYILIVPDRADISAY